ncbi:MAG: hypothetical protein ACREJ2_16960 [Planctomycetota bacterium]
MPRPAAFRTVALLLGLIAAGTLGVLLWRALAAHREVPPPLVPPSVAGPRVSAEAPPVTAARALADWRKALAAGDWQTANRIEDQVVQLGDAAVPQLEAALAADSGSPDPIAALVVEEDRAAALLGRIGTPAAVAALLRVRPHCADAEVRGQVLLALAKTGPAFEGKVEPVLESALTDAHETDEIRSSMPVLIAKRGETQGIADLCRLADQTAPADRQAAAWAITGLGFAPAAAGAQPGTTLRRILQQDAQPDRRALAAAALGQREDLADQPVLFAAA